MKCVICGKEIKQVTGELIFNSMVLGYISIPDLEYEECSGCGERLIPPETNREAIRYVSRKERQAIELLPFNNFISANEAADLLGMTRQAFSKNARIKRGLILSAKKGNRRFYERKSVELFKEKRNGKYKVPTADLVISGIKKESVIGGKALYDRKVDEIHQSKPIRKLKISTADIVFWGGVKMKDARYIDSNKTNKLRAQIVRSSPAYVRNVKTNPALAFLGKSTTNIFCKDSF